MWAPTPIADSGWWLETNQSAISAVRLSGRALHAFGYSEESLVLPHADGDLP
jgi:hypothetical protein